MTATRKEEWFDDDSFWRATYPFMFPRSRMLGAEEEVENALDLTRPAGKSALDLCCGPGRCSIALAKRGFAVTGVDRTRHLLQRARRKARDEGVKVRWLERDMRDFVSEGSYDVILSMFTSFGYFDDEADDLRVLGNVFASLRPGGSCLFDLLGKERLARILLETNSEVLSDGSMLVQRRRIIDDWTRVETDWVLIGKGQVKRFRNHLTVYSGRELRDRMESVGFDEVRLYGNLAGDPYGPDASRLVVVARRRVSG
jgi:SAM-dependent methyltransferase